MGMSIDEAIIKYKKLSEEAENNATSYAHLEEFKRKLKHNTEARYCELSKEECLASATEYKQLTEWLERLQKIEQILKLTYDYEGRHFCDCTTREIINRLAECELMLEKIEQIVKSWNDMNSFDSMVQISEVVEDVRS